VATRRLKDADGTAKSGKDRVQALSLIEALVETRRIDALADAFMEAWDRGNAWRDAIRASIGLFDDATAAQIRTNLRKGIERLDADPRAYEI
jgi:hypothetical protein